MQRLFEKIKSLTVSAYIFYYESSNSAYIFCYESSNKIYIYGNLNLLVSSSINLVLITYYDRWPKLSSSN